MLEKLFSRIGRERSPEEAERIIKKIARHELVQGVNGPTIYVAFTVAQKENQEKKLGMTNNYLLNIVQDVAIESSGIIEDSLYGSPEQTVENIKTEITKIRSELSEEERKS